MKLSHRHRKASAGPDMTPMIDIVFLLIIFFMTVSQVSETNREQVALPKLEGTKDQTPQTLTINIAQDGSTTVSGNNLSLTQIIGVATTELAKAGGDPSSIAVVLRADENVQSKAVNDVVEALSRLRITRIRFAVQVPQ